MANVKTLSLRIDEDLLNRIDEWGMNHLEDGTVRYNRNNALKRLIEMALALPDPEEVEGEGEEPSNPTLAEVTVEDLRTAFRAEMNAALAEHGTEVVKQIATVQKLQLDTAYRDITTAYNTGNQTMAEQYLLPTRSTVASLKEAEEARAEKEAQEPEKKGFFARLFG